MKNELIKDLTYFNYAYNRDNSPEIPAENWSYFPNWKELENAYQDELFESKEAELNARKKDLENQLDEILEFAPNTERKKWEIEEIKNSIAGIEDEIDIARENWKQAIVNL